MKKTILHIIYNLGRGGAETMLVTVLKELNDYNNIVVTLNNKNHFAEELKCDKYYCLELKSILQLPLAAPQLRKIIKKNKVDIVHSHLYWPTILARIGTPKNVQLITTIHAFIATSLEYKIPYIKFLDKLTYKFRKSIIVAVAEGALTEYFNFLKLKPGKAYALHTFVDVKTFAVSNAILKRSNNPKFKLITVAALKKQKNHKYLIEAFSLLDNNKFQLDIYGEGPLYKSLQQKIKSNNLSIELKGEVKNIHHIIPQYDLFVMSSTYEGFSLSVLEAMAMQMPLLLSDIKSFKEQCESAAVYFDLSDVNDFVAKLKALADDDKYLAQIGLAAYERVINNFTLEQHMQGLRKIYSEALEIAFN